MTTTRATNAQLAGILAVKVEPYLEWGRWRRRAALR
jgi:hypothetical protein